MFWLLFACQSEEGVKAYNANPEITITSHSDNAALEEGVLESFRAAVSDPNHDTEDLLVSWYVNTDLVCDWAAPDVSGTSYCDIRAGIDSTRVVAEVRDPDGSGGQNEVLITVTPTEAPTISLSSPTESGNYTSDRLVEFAAMVGDTEDPSEELSVKWSSSLEGELPLPEFSDSDGLLSGSAYLIEGQHFIQATVTDSTGKQSQTDVTILVGPPNTPPLCEITSPQSNSISVLGEAIYFEGTTSDAESDPTTLEATWASSLDGQLAVVNPTSSGEILLSTAGLSAGSHSIRLDVTDGTATCADEIFLTIGEPPSVHIDSPADGATVNAGTTTTFTATVSDDSTAENQLEMEWISSIDGNFSTFPATSSGLAQASVQLSAGQHIVTVRATDGDGLIGDASIVLTVNALPTEPTVDITPDPAFTTSTITATAYGSTDAEGQSISYSYAWSKNGVLTNYTGQTVPSSATAKGEVWSVEATPSDGFGNGPSGGSDTVVSNSPPVVSAVVVTPSSAQVGDTVTCSATVTDPDEVPVETFLWVNQTTGLTLGTTASLTIDSTMADVGQSVACELTATDSDGAMAAGASSFTVLNSDPSIVSLVISPSNPSSSDTAECTAIASDPDDDALTISYNWTINGAPMANGSSMSLALAVRGDLLACIVEVTDSNGATSTATAVETVSNQVPVISSVVMSPDPPASSSVMTCSETATDGDGDPLTTSIDWYVNGNFVGTTGFLAGPFSLNDVIRCEVTVNDGMDSSQPVSAELTVSNGPPVISDLSISPDPATTSDTLTVNVVVTDPEGDPVTLAYSWSINGISTSVAGDVLSAGYFMRDDMVSVTVTPFDGQSTGVSQTAVLVISNTPPEPPSISVSPPTAQDSEDLICEIDVDSVDLDGDFVAYLFEWTVNGSPFMGSANTTNHSGDTIPSSETTDGEVWACTVVPDDGTDFGVSATAQANILSVGCSGDAEWMMEVVTGMWACVNDSNITTYTQNFDMCAPGFTPVTYDLVQSLGLPYPTQQESSDFGNWYQSRSTSGDTSYIRTGQKRRGGCNLNDHGDLYISPSHGYSTPGEGWYDLYYGGGSCSLDTHAANNVSGHPLAGVLCVYGSYVPPSP